MHQFDNEYVYLESNVKRTAPDQVSNSLGNFITHLPKKFNFSNEWEVALAEISYTKSWYNLVDDEKISIKNVSGMEYGSSKNLLISGHYKNVNDLLKSINLVLKEIGKENSFYETPQLVYNNSSRIVSIEVGCVSDPKDSTIDVTKEFDPITLILLPKFSLRLNSILGLLDSMGTEFDFTNTKIMALNINNFKNHVNSGKPLLDGFREVTLDASIRSLFVYCNIIQPVSVGDTYAQLIRQVEIPANRQFGEQCDIKYQNLYYMPLLFNEFESIEVDIKDDTNTPISFEFGKTSLVLHFRKRNNVKESVYDLLR